MSFINFNIWIQEDIFRHELTHEHNIKSYNLSRNSSTLLLSDNIASVLPDIITHSIKKRVR